MKFDVRKLESWGYQTVIMTLAFCVIAYA